LTCSFFPPLKQRRIGIFLAQRIDSYQKDYIDNRIEQAYDGGVAVISLHDTAPVNLGENDGRELVDRTER